MCCPGDSHCGSQEKGGTVGEDGICDCWASALVRKLPGAYAVSSLPSRGEAFQDKERGGERGEGEKLDIGKAARRSVWARRGPGMAAEASTGSYSTSRASKPYTGLLSSVSVIELV